MVNNEKFSRPSPRIMCLNVDYTHKPFNGHTEARPVAIKYAL